MHHIIHHNDRDGWGSAALFVSQYGATNCRLYPCPGGDVQMLILGLQRQEGDTVWVLDLPAPSRWRLPAPSGLEIRWVDHHLASWHSPPPEHVKAILPLDDRPVTTMHLLIEHGVVTTPGARLFLRSMCVPEFESDWALAFDGLETMEDNRGIDVVKLTEHLATAPLGKLVPPLLQPAVERARAHRETVHHLLEHAIIDDDSKLVVARLDDAEGIKLKHYCLALRAAHPGRLVAIVHRRSLIYCGRDSRSRGLDLLAHFQARGLEPTGHSYVCFVKTTAARVENELEALRLALREGDTT